MGAEPEAPQAIGAIPECKQSLTYSCVVGLHWILGPGMLLSKVDVDL